MRLVLKMLFLLFALNSCAQKEPIFYIDVTNYNSGSVVVMLDLGDTHYDTVVIDTTGCGRLQYKESFKMYGRAFKFISKSTDSEKHYFLKELKTENDSIAENEILYQHGLFMERNGTSFLIFRVGTKADLSIEFDIDDPKLDEQIIRFE